MFMPEDRTAGFPGLFAFQKMDSANSCRTSFSCDMILSVFVINRCRGGPPWPPARWATTEGCPYNSKAHGEELFFLGRGVALSRLFILFSSLCVRFEVQYLNA